MLPSPAQVGEAGKGEEGGRKGTGRGDAAEGGELAITKEGRVGDSGIRKASDLNSHGTERQGKTTHNKSVDHHAAVCGGRLRKGPALCFAQNRRRTFWKCLATWLSANLILILVNIIIN